MAQQARRRRLEVTEVDDVVVVNFLDKKILDDQNIQIIGDELIRLVDELARLKIVLNFRNVEFLSSAFLGKLVKFNGKVQAAGGKLVLCEIKKDLLEVFILCKLDKLLVIHESEQEALKTF
jgi:anti-sigma B factor antagonist